MFINHIRNVRFCLLALPTKFTLVFYPKDLESEVSSKQRNVIASVNLFLQLYNIKSITCYTKSKKYYNTTFFEIDISLGAE